jgi:N-acetylneuraminic acid mutarotase
MKKLLLITATVFFIQTGNAQTITWKKLESLPKPCAGGEAVVLNNNIYLVAGNHAQYTESSDFYRYDISENKWYQQSNLPRVMGQLAVAEVAGKIFAIGGSSFSNTNYVYNPETNSWDSVAPMPTARQGIDCGIVDDKIYVIGGVISSDGTFNTASIVKKNEVYDPATNTWSEKTSIPTLRNNPAIVTMDSLVYVIAGAGSPSDIWKNIGTVECYNPKTDSWITKSNLPIKPLKPGAVMVNNTIVVLGGMDANNNSLSTVLIYNKENDTWKSITPLPKVNYVGAYASVGNKIYVIGGSNSTPTETYYSDVYEGTLIDSVPSSVNTFKSEYDLNIFPNPVRDKFTISFGNSIQHANVAIFTLDGRQMVTQTFHSASSETIDLSDFSAGMYFVRITADGVRYEEKVIKE